MRCRAKVAVEGVAQQDGWTIDLSMQGVSMMLHDTIAIGRSCAIKFGRMEGGKLLEVSAVAKVVYSILGNDGYRIGFQFTQMDAGSKSSLTQLMV